MEQYYGYFLYLLSLLTMGGIYAVLTLGLNVQWGFTGLFNAGIAGFFAVGAYTQAILTTPLFERHLGGFNWPIPLAMLAAMVLSAVVAYAVAKIIVLESVLGGQSWPCILPASLLGDGHSLCLAPIASAARSVAI